MCNCPICKSDKVEVNVSYYIVICKDCGKVSKIEGRVS